MSISIIQTMILTQITHKHSYLYPVGYPSKTTLKFRVTQEVILASLKLCWYARYESFQNLHIILNCQINFWCKFSAASEYSWLLENLIRSIPAIRKTTYSVFPKYYNGHGNNNTSKIIFCINWMANCWFFFFATKNIAFVKVQGNQKQLVFPKFM